jgi:prepilin-type N-terminal cleavage/methylation domain-containing protein/prepilin-type processing-associated H-X9-DG protein
MRRRSGFTLVELLVVIGIIVVLIAILLPVLNKAREQARTVHCQSNIRQILMAMFCYADDNRGVLPIPQGNDLVSYWGVVLYNGQPGQLDYNQGHSKLLRYISRSPATVQEIFVCPSDFEPRSTGNLNVTLAGTWDGQVHPDPTHQRNFSYTFSERLMMRLRGVKLTQIVSSDQKILVLEEELPWKLHNEPLMENDFVMPPTWSCILTKRHSGLANEGFADGHVERMGPGDFPPLSTPEGQTAFGKHVPLTGNTWRAQP